MGYRRLATAILAAAIAGSGCGLGTDHSLNARSLDSQITAQLKSRYPVSRVEVSCPSGVKEKVGSGFSCSATLDGQRLTLDGTVTSAGGKYSIHPAEAIVVSTQAAAALQQEIGAQLHQAVSVDCGQPAVRVVAAGGQFECAAMIGGQSRGVSVTVLDASGHTRFSLTTGSAVNP